MTMTDRPAIPAELMDDQPVPDAQLDLLAELAAAFPGTVHALAAEAERFDPEAPVDELMHRLQSPAAVDAVRSIAADAPAVVAFAVTDRPLAEWALRKLQAVEAVRKERRELAATWKAEVDRWLADELRPLDARYTFLEGHLLRYGRQVREADGTATIKLPSGTLASTGHKAKPAIQDQDEVLAWAEALPEAIRDGEASPIKRTAEVQISRLAKLVKVHKLEEPRNPDDEGDDEVVVTYVATLAYDPETGEEWPEGTDPRKHAIPGVRVEPEGASYRVTLT